MRKLQSVALGLASLMLFSSPVLASEKEENQLKKGWYFHLGGGGTYITGTDADWKVDGTEYSGSLDNDWGGAVEGGVGYDFGEWSTDVVYKYRWFNNNDINFSGNRPGYNLQNVSVGDSSWQTVLLGIYKDFQAKDSKFFFKIGPVAGLGCYDSPDVTAKYTFVRQDLTRSRKVKVKVDGANECSFAWGGKAGIGYEIDKNWDLTLDAMWVSQSGGSTSSGGKKRTVSYSITEPTEETAWSLVGTRVVGGSSCSLIPSPKPAACFDETTTTGETTTTVVRNINVNSMRYSATEGLNLMLGLRYTFGSKPKPDPKVVVEEVVIEEEVQPTPVRGLW